MVSRVFPVNLELLSPDQTLSSFWFEIFCKVQFSNIRDHRKLDFVIFSSDTFSKSCDPDWDGRATWSKTRSTMLKQCKTRFRLMFLSCSDELCKSFWMMHLPEYISKDTHSGLRRVSSQSGSHFANFLV